MLPSMARRIYRFLLFCFCASHVLAADTLYQGGDSLNSSNTLVSKNGLFTLGFTRLSCILLPSIYFFIVIFILFFYFKYFYAVFFFFCDFNLTVFEYIMLLVCPELEDTLSRNRIRLTYHFSSYSCFITKVIV